MLSDTQISLNELYDNNVQCLPRQENLRMEFDRKSFIKYWLAYHQYPKLAQRVDFDLSQESYSAMIVLLRTNGNDFYDPLSDIKSFEEEDFTNLHSGGTPRISSHKKIKSG